ncbi:three-helix bundle dimerization domain-containing protein [Nocardia seriolae]|uniref:Uncharacterized protein n=1 Tax=Nocardia seriolae TaxID=37332 RepID=A0ABC9YTE8_9NOCA|nr:hypothetical protein [Nocardia seriolae]GAM46833.1 hypothetical protein NS07_v2contig00038-0044 [Nocardia seriolae]GAP28704.1 hypothetical protein NSK11_contig00041-0015 [Nocardia seriolae]
MKHDVVRNDEATQILFIQERLTRRHPEVPETIIAGIVARARDAFTDAKVRNFVPRLVERRAIIELAASPAR